MKNKNVLLILILQIFLILVTTSQINAYVYEIGIIVLNSQGANASLPVYVYKYNSSSKNYEPYGSGSSSHNYGVKNIRVNGSLVPRVINCAFDITGDGNYLSDPTINSGPLERFGGLYIIRIENTYFSITCGYNDIEFIYQNGAFSVIQPGNNSYTYNFNFGPWSEKTITLKNDFGNDRTSCYGKILFNSDTLSNVGYSGTTLTRESGTFPHTIAGEDLQYVNSYYRKWRNWTEDGYTPISEVISSPQTITRTAKYAKRVDATISLNPNGSTITMNGNTITGSQYMYEDLSYIFDAENQVSSTWISYTFDHWIYDNITVTSNIITINNPSSGHSLAAYFIGTARPDPMNIHFTSTDGQYISLGWTEHPDNGVTQYQVWRSVTGGNTGAIATLNRGTTSFTDYQYIQNASGATKLFYTVKAYYAPSGTWNDPGYILNRGDGTPQPSIANNNNNQLNELGKELPEEYSINNYPNPFNPTTTINYQLPEDGFVTIKVFDILGKEVATLVNENKSAGYYRVNFDANSAGGGLTSGVYIYRIDANGFTQSKKMLLMK